MLKFFGFDIMGVEIVKPGLVVEGFVFSIALILTLHYGLLLILNGLSSLRRRHVKLFLLSVVYVAIACGIFFVLVRSNWLNNVLLYVWLTLYGSVLLSRGFFNWYNKANEMSRKLDKIINLLERTPK